MKAATGVVGVLLVVVAAGALPLIQQQRGAPLLPLLILEALIATGLAAAVYHLLREPRRLRAQVRERTARLETALDEARRHRQHLEATTEHLQRVLHTSPDAVIAGDGEGRITDWNAAAERLFGWRRDEAIGQHCSIVVPDGEPILALDGPHDAGTVRAVVPRRRKDASTFQAELTISLFRRREGAGSWVTVARDVTTERLLADAQDAVRSSLQPAEAMAALTGTLAGLVDGIEVASLVEVKGTTAKRLVCISRGGEILAPVEHLTLTESLLGPAVEGGRVTRESGFVSDRAFGPAWVSWRVVVPIHHSDGVVAAIGLAGNGDAPPDHALALLGRVADAVAQDVVNVLLYERQRETMERLYDLDQLKSDFLSAVSHELRTPLTAITGFSATLDERWDEVHPEMRRNFVRRILERALALEALVVELLDFARVERRNIQVEPVPCDLAREVRREVDAVAHALRNHAVRVDVPDGLLVSADPGALSRVLQNLLTNAAKFSPPETEVAVTAGRDAGGAVVVRVEDEGIGIAASEHQRIFERFYRVGRGDRMRASGTGIGLALVKEYAEALGGRVWVESEPGRGSTFCFTLPRAEAGSPTDEVVQEPASLTDRGRRPVPGVQANGVGEGRQALR